MSRAILQRRSTRDLPPRLAALGLVPLMLGHLLVAAGRIHRDPAPRKTFHDHDEHLVHHPMIFRGERRAPSLPISELVPPDMDGLGAWETLDAAFGNSPERTRAYRTTTPLHFVVSAIPATVMGVGVWTVRLGPALVLWALLLVVFDLARRLTGSRAAGLLAATLLGALPAVHQGTVIGIPALGNMLGVSLGLWALLQSDGLSRWGFAALAGAFLALTTRWGESVGDGLECLVAVAGPAVLVALLPLARLFRRGQRIAAARGIVGAAIAAALGWGLTDRWWLGLHLERYVLAEAGVTGPSPSVFDRIGTALEVLSRTGASYPEAITWSLAGPLAVGVFLAGTAAWLALGGRRLQALWLLSSVLGGGVALSLSDKGQDTYAVGLLPAFAVLAAGGLWRLPGVLRWLALPGVGLVVTAGLFQAHMDLPSMYEARCQPTLARYLAVDPYRCERGHNAQPAVYHWFKEWRREPNPQDLARTAIGRWVRYEEGRRWLDSLAPGALVLLQRPPGPGGGADVLVLLAQSMRPDIFVHTVKGMNTSGLTSELLARHDDVWVLTFVRDMTRGGGIPQEPIGGLAPLTRQGGWRHVHIYRRDAPAADVDAGSSR